MRPSASNSHTSARRSAADIRSGGRGFGRFIGREGAGVKATLIGELGIVVDIRRARDAGRIVIRFFHVVNDVDWRLWNFPMVLGLRLR
jgi:hypothetical protein